MNDSELYHDLFRPRRGLNLFSDVPWEREEDVKVSPDLWDTLLDVAAAEGVPVTVCPPPKTAPPSAGGCYSAPGGPALATGRVTTTGAIWINSEHDRDRQTRSLAHELSHHFTPDFQIVGSIVGLPGLEIIAESAAYIFGRHIGYDTNRYSAGYVQGWATDLYRHISPSLLEPVVHDVVGRLESAINQTTARRAA